MASPWSKGSPFTPRHSLNYSFLGDSATTPRSQQKVPLTSQLLEETDQRRVETFGPPLPVQISEKLTNQESNQHTTVRIDQSGWAWLVSGRKLFIWRFIPAAGTKGVFFKELTLPASELYHVADLICVISPAGDSKLSSVSVMAVSPEGLVRYWPSLTHDSNTVDVDTDLIGSKCHSLTAFQPYGCILLTTTNELLLLTGLQKTVKCQNLNASSGVFTDLGRRMTSFIFGSQPASQRVTNWQKVLASSNHTTDNSRELYVLSENQLFTWNIVRVRQGSFSEKLVAQVQLENMFKAAVMNTPEGYGKSADDILVWCLDVVQTSSGILVLAAVAVRKPQSSQLFYFLGGVKTTPAPVSLSSLTALPYSVTYIEAHEDKLLDFKLLLSQQNSSAFVYNSNSIICVSVSEANEVLNKVDLQSPADSILGAGLYQGKPLFFSSKYGVITVAIMEAILSEQMDSSNVHSLEVTQKTGNLSLSDASFRDGDNHLQRLKSAFLLFCQGHIAEAQSICRTLDGEELDNGVVALSEEIIDDFPVSDPRWAESIPAGGLSASTSLIILHQLEDKLKAHVFMVDFLKGVGLWKKLEVFESKEGQLLTCHLICEHGEKLKAAIALCKVDKKYQGVVDGTIGLVMKKQRLRSQIEGLTEQDVFFREVSRISDIFTCLLEYEEQLILKQKSSSSQPQTIAAVNTVLKEMLFEAWQYRQDQFETYQPSNPLTDMNFEHVPWTATAGPDGIRAVLLKQIKLTAKQGMGEFADQQTKSLLVQHMVDLADILLDGYVKQLQYLRAFQITYLSGERQKLMTIHVPEQQNDDLSRFLSSHHHLSWLHDIHLKSFYQAHRTLKALASEEACHLGKKKTLLSLKIINEHNIILHQETLPSAQAGLDVDSMAPLSPSELIELHVGDKNTGANEYDFKNALDILHLAVQTGAYDQEQATTMKLYIWRKALLRDDWPSLPTKDPLMTVRNTIFFRTVELAYNQGVELQEFIPSLESLIDGEELKNTGLSENATFHFLLKSGYERMERAAVLSL
ncbi:hypothetical protein pdam_00002883 [Pocillopora damicornis]|uniref:Uncharacterized protein n=1 Tax=Pocillopora damicornis TaxID=46731 RepID=A0A3M6U8V0_POCDA|nr:hypothetical protein pdam_00002883 [Pocillopora damicornis]